MTLILKPSWGNENSAKQYYLKYTYRQTGQLIETAAFCKKTTQKTTLNDLDLEVSNGKIHYYILFGKKMYYCPFNCFFYPEKIYR